MREVVTTQDVEMANSRRAAVAGVLAAGEVKPVSEPDKYKDRLVKYVPAEVIAVYLAGDSGIHGLRKLSEQVPQQTLLWVIAGILFIATWPYLKYVQKVNKVQQLIISVVSFAVWVFTIGGPFASFTWYSPLYGAAFLPLYTFLIGIIEAKQ